MKVIEIVEDSDHLLIQKSKQGDKQAFSDLVKRYEKKIFSLILSLLANQQDAEDLTQEVFVRAYFSLNSYREESKFFTWLYRIAYNMCIDFKRRVSSRIKAVTTINDDLHEQLNFIEDKNVKPADEMIENRELSLSLKQALSEISEEHRAVMILREVDGLSYDEIAKITGSARGTVMSRLHYARKHLQKVLAGFVNDHSDSSECLLAQKMKIDKAVSEAGLVDILFIDKILVLLSFVYITLSIVMHNYFFVILLSLMTSIAIINYCNLIRALRQIEVKIFKGKRN